jgi:Ribbon-helix-helix protein, copG family
MAKATVSAHVSQEIIDRLDSIAQTERRNRSQVVSIALEFFVLLPPPARAAWLKIVTTESPQQIAALIEKIAQVAIDTQSQIFPDPATNHLELLAEENDLLEQW